MAKKAKKPKKVPSHKTFLVPKLRSASLYWPPRTEALNRAKTAPGRFKCSMCEGEFKRHEVHVDHDPPVIDPRVGFVDFNTYIERLFCTAEFLRVLCVTCHDTVTNFQKELKASEKEKK